MAKLQITLHIVAEMEGKDISAAAKKADEFADMIKEMVEDPESDGIRLTSLRFGVKELEQ